MSVFADGSPTVTIFADQEPLAGRIGDELRARGAATHTVSIEAGWVDSVSRAVVLIDSAAGRSAVEDLCDRTGAPVRVVALVPDDAGAADEDLCDRCREDHDVTVLRTSESDVVKRVAREVVGPHVA